jgi:hypothetical protein
MTRFIAPWKASMLVQQLSCEQLGGANQACSLARQRSLLVLRLIGVSLLPALLLVSGVALLGRELWLLFRRRLPPPPPLLSAQLSRPYLASHRFAIVVACMDYNFYCSSSLTIFIII